MKTKSKKNRGLTRKPLKKQNKRKKVFASSPLVDEPPEYYWEGEDGEGYKEDGCPWLFSE